MEFKITLPGGGVLEFKREPLDSNKFYALVGLAAGALIVVWFLGSIALR